LDCQTPAGFPPKKKRAFPSIENVGSAEALIQDRGSVPFAVRVFEEFDFGIRYVEPGVILVIGDFPSIRRKSDSITKGGKIPDRSELDRNRASLCQAPLPEPTLCKENGFLVYTKFVAHAGVVTNRAT
jgi:hypothetical protein